MSHHLEDNGNGQNPRAQQAVLNYQEYVTRHSDVDLVNYWRTTGEKLEFIQNLSANGKVENWYPPSDKRIADTIWTDIHAYENEKDYATQKHEQLLDRILKAASNEGDVRRRFLLWLRHHRCRSRKTGAKVDCHRPRQVRHPHHA